MPGKKKNTKSTLISMGLILVLFAVVVVFVFGIVVDFFRKKVFELVMRK